MTPLRANARIMCLFANGVDELQFTEMQREILKAGHKLVTAAPASGVVQSWHGTSWGHFYPVDQVMGEALGSDYDALVLPGGKASTAKLRENLHTRRLVNHFMEAGKPVLAIGEAVGLLALSPRIAGRTVAAVESERAILEAAQAEMSGDVSVTDGALITAPGPEPQEWVSAARAMLANVAPAEMAKAA